MLRLLISSIYLSVIMNIAAHAQDDLYGDPIKRKDSTYQIIERNPCTAGQIVTTMNDTINCFILNQKSYYEGKLRYKLNLQSKKFIKINTDQINHLSIDTINYERINSEGFSYLMLRLIDGPVKLYDNVLLRSTGPMLLPLGSPISYNFIERRYYVVRNNIVYKISRSTFRDDLKRIFNGNPEYINLADEIKYGDFIANIEKIITEYNNTLPRGTNANEVK